MFRHKSTEELKGESARCHDFNEIIEKYGEKRKNYDEETERILQDIKNSNWEVRDYLREILWELTYARRRSRRP